MKVAGASPEGWHSIDAKFRCDWEYLARNIRGIEPSGNIQTPAPLAAGLLFHAARARWFTLAFGTGDEIWASILQAVREEAAIQKLPIAVEIEQDVLKLMTLYVKNWKDMPKPTVVGAEYPIGPSDVTPNSCRHCGGPIKELPGGLGVVWLHDNSSGWYAGQEMTHDAERVESLTRTARLDDVSRYVEGGNQLWIGEAKTTSGTISQLVDEYEINGQTMLQVLLWDIAPQGRAMHGPIAGVMLDAAGKAGRARKEIEFARVPIQITDFQIAWFRESLIKELTEAKEMRDKGWDFPAERNPKACLRESSGAFVGKCPYWELCKHGRSATGNYQMKDGRSLLDHVPKEGEWKMPWER